MTVTVISKSGLLDHGNKTKEAAVEYRSQISSVQRKIEAKVTGQEADAIKAFIAKLNSLSQTLHDSYPLTLELYSEAVLKYEAGLTAAGFSSEVVKTKATDIQSIKTWLGETKSKEFLEKSEDLDMAIQTASKALALEPGAIEFTRDAGARAHSIAMNLARHGDERQKTHDELENNLKQFISGLTVVSERLVGVKATLDNARFISSFSLNTAMDLISKGYLNEQNMDFLDSIQNEGDAKVLKVVLGEQGYSTSTGFFTALGSVDTTKVSHAMMDIVYNRVNKEFSNVKEDKSPAMENLRTYIQAIANQDQEKAKTYFENLVLAGDRYAQTITELAKALVPDFPKTNDSESEFKNYEAEKLKIQPQLEGFNEHIKRAGVLTSLFESLYVVGIGKSKKVYPSMGSNMSLDTSIVLSGLTFNEKNGFEFNISAPDSMGIRRDESYSTEFFNAGSGVQNAEAISEIRELREKRDKEAALFAVDLAKMAIGSFIPGSGKILDLISSSVRIENNLSSSLNFGDKAGTVTFSDLYKKKVGEKMSDSSTLSDHLEKYYEYDQRITKREQFLAGSIFDTGGRHLTGNSKDKFVKYDLTYDLQANMKIYDLEKNGLKTFVYHNTEGDISKKISSIKEYERTMKEIASTNNIDNPKDEKNERLLTQNTFDLFTNKGNIGVNNVTSSNIYEGLTKLDNMFVQKKSRIVQRENYLKWDPYGLSTNDSNFGIKQENS
ncbi:hypothetical protein [Streptococcus sp. HMSC078D09]|uniref:hypothetical protein n=1 Tax=Streptococcus sp. HMSC078D09 TaxID=1739430 RepID=UPI0008A1EB3D|nr:hypothetical protein [Streptococcus sp. HMSC078D09]OFQ67397.1 hypothetical protein HMPREF2926_02810 [Streptococcus sp. HMSC078D09]